MLWLTFFVIVRCERSDLYMKAITVSVFHKLLPPTLSYPKRIDSYHSLPNANLLRFIFFLAVKKAVNSASRLNSVIFAQIVSRGLILKQFLFARSKPGSVGTGGGTSITSFVPNPLDIFRRTLRRQHKLSSLITQMG